MSEQISYFDISGRGVFITLSKVSAEGSDTFEVSVQLPQRDGDERDDSETRDGLSYEDAVDDYLDCIRCHLESHMP